MKYAIVKMSENSHVSMDQNEVTSTIYVLDGLVTVENKVGKSVRVLPGEKISIGRNESNKQDLDLKIAKEDIDDIFKDSDWFLTNNGNSYLNKPETTDEAKTLTGSKVVSNGSRVLLFDTISDDANISTSTIDVTGKFIDSNIVKITVNNTLATLDTTNKTFSFKNISTANSQNDLVFRAYDNA